MQGRASASAPHGTLPSALSPILGTWPEPSPQDIWQHLHRSGFNLKLACMQDILPGLGQKHHATPFLIQLELFQATEAESAGKGGCRLGRLPQEVGHDWVFP